MHMPRCFYIDGVKSLIFRQEENCYITFDPVNLEFIRLNYIGAEILYCISLNINYGNMVDYFIEKYCIESDIVKKDIKQFLDGYSCEVLIQGKLSELNFNSY
ncbi:hypothetical protein K413DRAFT_3433 [Clostridium sp. ASBs410]|nr:hypothetical protein K413DRAFT_3433 [Clostridium sp. ASBs410]